MKAFTDIEQSKKLSEILTPESADMYYFDDNGGEPNFKVRNGITYYYDNEDCLPCWSLSALLGVLPDYTLQTNTDGTVFVVCESKKPMISDAYDNPIDACVEVITRLNELNLL